MTGVLPMFHDALTPWTARFSRNPSSQEVFVNNEDRRERERHEAAEANRPSLAASYDAAKAREEERHAQMEREEM